MEEIFFLVYIIVLDFYLLVTVFFMLVSLMNINVGNTKNTINDKEEIKLSIDEKVTLDIYQQRINKYNYKILMIDEGEQKKML